MKPRCASLAPVVHTVDDRSWHARLQLDFSIGPNGTRLKRCRHSGPLYVQRPFYPEGADLAHVYLLHPPAGLVSGDSLKFDITIGEQARTLITTPGATRVYRARREQPEQRQHTRIKLANRSSLEWFPLETIVYDTADVDLKTEIELSGDSRFIGWEISCLGLPASNKPFRSGHFTQLYRIVRDGQPLFVDRIGLTGQASEILHGMPGLQGQAVSGFFLAGPLANGHPWLACMADLREMAAPGQGVAQSSVTRVGELYLGRYLGGSAEQARGLFGQWWQRLRPELIGRPACAPRIWST